VAKVPRIGILDDTPMWQAFRQALRELGYIEGQNIAYEYRYSEGAPDRLAAVAAELVRRPVDVIATYGTPPTQAAKEATATIPIVMIGIGDPVRAGLVASLARPGGNITGNTVIGPDLSPKRLQILHEGADVHAADLPPELSRSRPAAAVEGEADPVLVPLADVERRHVERVLNATGWNKARAARVLDVDVKTLNKKIRDYSLEKPS